MLSCDDSYGHTPSREGQGVLLKAGVKLFKSMHVGSSSRPISLPFYIISDCKRKTFHAPFTEYDRNDTSFAKPQKDLLNLFSKLLVRK